MSCDTETYSPRRSAWTDAGACMIQVNHRGSTGYGPEWTAAIAGRPGLTGAQDIARVRDWAVRTGPAASGCCVLSGASPPVYAAAPPITFVSAVRAPVLVTAADNDPRCPPEQVTDHLAALDRQRVRAKLLQMHPGHGARTADDRIAQLQQELEFCRSYVGF